MKINSFWRKDMTAAEARTGRGFLQVNVVNIENNFPVQNAKISVSRTDAP